MQVKQLERPSSDSLEAWLLPTDDVRVHAARTAFTESTRRNAGRVDWGRCESRHRFAREMEQLGNRRPIT
jgi:hypothetical protein